MLQNFLKSTIKDKIALSTFLKMASTVAAANLLHKGANMSCQDIFMSYQTEYSEDVLQAVSLLIHDTTGGHCHLDQNLLRRLLYSIINAPSNESERTRKERVGDIQYVLRHLYKLTWFLNLDCDINVEMVFMQLEALFNKPEWTIDEMVSIFRGQQEAIDLKQVVGAVKDAHQHMAHADIASLTKALLQSCQLLQPIGTDFDMIKGIEVMQEAGWPDTLQRIVVAAWSVDFHRTIIH